jgi:flavorubredoxin
MAIEILEDVYWINNCFEKPDGNHLHISVYLLKEGDDYILVDTGSSFHEQNIQRQVDDLTENLSAILLTHNALHHSENTLDMREHYGDVDLYTSFEGGPASAIVLGMGESSQYNIGGSQEIAGREFGFPVPPLADRGSQTWVFDYETRTLFAGDGFGTYHQPGECENLPRDQPGILSQSDITKFNRQTFPWMKLLDPSKIQETVEEFLETWEVENIAPVHGYPLLGDDVSQYMDSLERAIHEIPDTYQAPEISSY